MILSGRSPSHYPLNSELAPSLSSPDLLASPPITPPRTQKHAFSKPMTWINRTSAASHQSASLPHPAPKPTRISEPRIPSSLDQFGFHRSGPLGSGATVVRTPQEALFGSTSTSDPTCEEGGLKQEAVSLNTEKRDVRLLSPVPPSPPLPPLPDVPHTTGDSSSTRVSLSENHEALPPRSCGSPSPARFSSPRPTLPAHSSAASRSTPTLPVNAYPAPPQPPFEAVLLSSIPDGPVDPSKLIVTLETCTDTYRTSLRTLTSRPSHLGRYIITLLSPTSETASLYSNASDAPSAQHDNVCNPSPRDHLVSAGCLPPSAGIRLFLDRSSAPYTHVLAYLRSLPSAPEHPEMLPRAVQLGSNPGPSSPRLESLLELRDEACYLGLEELEKLCTQEMQRVPRAPMPISHGYTGSVHSVHTVVERCQSRQEARPSASDGGMPKGSNNLNGARVAPNPVLTTRESSSGSLLESGDREVGPSMRGRQGRSIKHAEVGSPPPGWI